MSERYIVVRNWERFQHYKDRNPTWIKSHLEALDNEDYMGSSLAVRGLIECIWKLYARHKGVLTVNQTRHLVCTHRGDSRHFRRHIESLCNAGFIEITASRPVPIRYHRDRSKEEKIYKETETVGSTDVELPIEISNGEEPIVARLLEEIRDADAQTTLIVRGYRRRLPESAFAIALESLRYRRSQKPPLTSEARYVVATLTTIEKEG